MPGSERRCPAIAAPQPQGYRAHVARSVPRFTRRQVLATGAALATATVAVSGGRVASWWDRDAAEGYEALSAKEVSIVEALSDAMFPPGGDPALSGTEAGLARYFDGIMAAMDPPTDKLLRLLLNALDDWAFFETGHSYSKLPLEDRMSTLEGWMGHDSHHVRGAVSGLLVFLGMGYCGHPDVKAAAGWVFPCGYSR